MTSSAPLALIVRKLLLFFQAGKTAVEVCAYSVRCFSFLGWGGAGLGRSQQGIHNPISGGEVRDKFDKFKVRARPFYKEC